MIDAWAQNQVALQREPHHRSAESIRLKKSHQIAGLCVAVVVCSAIAAIGGLITTPQIPNWYAGLAKPSWTPPSWIFGPVWTLLYLMMAISVWLVWRQAGLAAAKLPVTLFVAQLVLNSVWSVLFFGMQNPGLAAVEIVLLWVAILATLIAFSRRSKLAAVLLLPYLAWVSFAAVLNFSIWQMNA